MRSEQSVGVGIILSLLLLAGDATATSAQSPSPGFPVQVAVNSGQQLPVSAQAMIGDRQVELEVARTPQQQATGLMYRKALADNRGMLFVFESPQMTRFWMKNVRIPLDMIFLRDGKVQAIAASALPCQTEPCATYGANTAVDQVIELRGGRAAELGLQVGDRIKIKFLDSQRQKS